MSGLVLSPKVTAPIQPHLWEIRGETYELPSTWDFLPGPVEWRVPVFGRAELEGSDVDTARIRIQPRAAQLRGLSQYPDLATARDQISRWASILSGDVGRMYPRDSREVYMRAVLRQWAATWDVGGLLVEVQAEFLCPLGLWESTTVYSASWSTTSASGTIQLVDVGGGHRVWPRITMTVTGGSASATNPRVEVLDGSGNPVRAFRFSGTLSAGSTLVADPTVPRATLDSQDVTAAVNAEWLAPSGRLWLPHTGATLRLAADSLTGTLSVTLEWRRLWL